MGAGDSNQDDTPYGVLRSDILDLKLRPGMIISIKDISESYQMGRTPVRDALIRLSKEGLITFLPQRGTMISRINHERAENGRFLRACVEEQVMLECMASCNIESLTELQLSLALQEKLLKEGDCRAFLEEDMNFHSVFYKAVNRNYCNYILSANSGDYHRIRLLSLTDIGIDKKIIKQHREIVDALTSRDSDRMHSVFVHHINRLVSQERSLIDKYPDLFDQEEEEVKRKPDGLDVDFLVETKLRYHV